MLTITPCVAPFGRCVSILCVKTKILCVPQRARFLPAQPDCRPSPVPTPSWCSGRPLPLTPRFWYGGTFWVMVAASLTSTKFVWMPTPTTTSSRTYVSLQATCILTYLCPSLPVELRPSTTPHHRILFWVVLAIPGELVP